MKNEYKNLKLNFERNRAVFFCSFLFAWIVSALYLVMFHTAMSKSVLWAIISGSILFILFGGIWFTILAGLYVSRSKKLLLNLISIDGNYEILNTTDESLLLKDISDDPNNDILVIAHDVFGKLKNVDMIFNNQEVILDNDVFLRNTSTGKQVRLHTVDYKCPVIFVVSDTISIHLEIRKLKNSNAQEYVKVVYVPKEKVQLTVD